MTPKEKMGRTSKQRGAAAERSLAKLLSEEFGLDVKRVASSGALKFCAKKLAGEADNYRGDLQLVLNGETYRIEVKTRTSLPKYVTKGKGEKIKDFCSILSPKQFLSLALNGNLPCGLTEVDPKCKELHDWFTQDDSHIVAMKERKKNYIEVLVKDKIVKKLIKNDWYFAVREDIIDKIGGKE